MERTFLFFSIAFLSLILFGILISSIIPSIYGDMNKNQKTVTQNLMIGNEDEYSENYVDNNYYQNDDRHYDDNINEEDRSNLMYPINPLSSNLVMYPMIFTSNMYPSPSIYEQGNGDIDSRGKAFFTFHPNVDTLDFEVFLYGMSYVEGDDVEVIDVHIGNRGEDGPSVLSLCNEIKGKGHCREGPGLSVEGSLGIKDLKGPLENSSFSELIDLIQSGYAYLNVQSRDYPEGEISGQIFDIHN